MLSRFTGSGAVPPAGTVNTGTPRSLARSASVRACPRFSLPSLISRIRRAPSDGKCAERQLQRVFNVRGHSFFRVDSLQEC